MVVYPFVSADGSDWKATPERFLVPHGATVQEYKQFFAAAMHQAGLHEKVPAEARKGKWVVDIKPVGDGQAVLKYLEPYVYRVVFGDNRIVACDDESLNFRWTPMGQKTSKTRTLTGEQFPHGYQKVRHYGWMSSNCRTGLDLVRWLVWLPLGWTYWLGSGHAPQPARRVPSPRKCEHCGGELVLVTMTNPRVGLLPLPALPLHGRKYLDSG